MNGNYAVVRLVGKYMMIRRAATAIEIRKSIKKFLNKYTTLEIIYVMKMMVSNSTFINSKSTIKIAKVNFKD